MNAMTHPHRRLKMAAAILLAALALTGVSLAAPTAPASADEVVSDFVGMTPRRLLDTRDPGSVGRVSRGQLLMLRFIADEPIALNLTVVTPTFNGWLGAFGCNDGFSGTSNVNFNPTSGTVANFAIVQPDTDGRICFITGGATDGTLDVLVDRYGGFSGTDFAAQTPARLFDSRDVGGPIGAEQVKMLDGFVPNSTQVLNLTVAQPQGSGFLTVYPCAAGRPDSSASNYQAGTTRAALTLATADAAGRVCIYTRQRTDLIVDKFGQMVGTAVGLSRPRRLMDSRVGNHAVPGRSFELSFPDFAGRAVAFTVTSVNPSTRGHISVYPCAADIPNASILNYAGIAATPNMVVLTPDVNGRVCFSSPVTTDLLVDGYGYLGQARAVPAVPNDRCTDIGLDEINRSRNWGPKLKPFTTSAVTQMQCENLNFVVNHNDGNYREQKFLPWGMAAFHHVLTNHHCEEIRDQQRGLGYFVQPYTTAGDVITKPTFRYADVSCMDRIAVDGTNYAHVEVWVSYLDEVRYTEPDGWRK